MNGAFHYMMRHTQRFCCSCSILQEIMATGYAIFAIVLLIFVPSVLRNRIPYEMFYGLHHLFIV